jgi:hypothetical protein
MDGDNGFIMDDESEDGYAAAGAIGVNSELLLHLSG